MGALEELTRLFRSFGYAAAGIAHAVATQRNLRIHLCAVLVVIFFGALAGLEPAEWCAVILCCMVVISLELVNTALERLCDAVTEEKTTAIKRAKDCAAGAVLAAAVGAAAVAAVLVNLHCRQIANAFAMYIWPRIVLPAGIILGVLFVFVPCLIQQKRRK